jgi:hypothetical protein
MEAKVWGYELNKKIQTFKKPRGCRDWRTYEEAQTNINMTVLKESYMKTSCQMMNEASSSKYWASCFMELWKENP